MASQNQRPSAKTAYGPLWQVTSAATDEELPRVLCHFLRTSLSSPVQPESPGASDRAQPAQDESDCELEVRALPKCEARMRLHARDHASLSTCLHAILLASISECTHPFLLPGDATGLCTDFGSDPQRASGDGTSADEGPILLRPAIHSDACVMIKCSSATPPLPLEELISASDRLEGWRAVRARANQLSL